MRHVISPWAPATGWRVISSKPVIAQSISWTRARISSAPGIVSTGCMGWSWAKPVMRAVCSLTFGLYFIVHEPSG